MLVSLTLGRYLYRSARSSRILAGRLTGGDTRWDASKYDVIFNLRLPRTIIAGVVGAALAGAAPPTRPCFATRWSRSTSSEPRPAPGFGAASRILLSFGGAGIEASAFVCGVVAVVVHLHGWRAASVRR